MDEPQETAVFMSVLFYSNDACRVLEIMLCRMLKILIEYLNIIKKLDREDFKSHIVLCEDQ